MSGALPDVLYPYLVGVICTLALIAFSAWTFISSSRRGLDYARREARLPLATRYEDLKEQVLDLEEDRDLLKDELFQAKATIEEADRKAQRLQEIDEELRTKEREYADLEQVRADYAQAAEQLAAEREALTQVQLERNKAEFERKAFADDSSRLQERIQQQLEESQGQEKRLNDLRAKAEEAMKETHDLRAEAGGLRVEVAELTTKRESLNSDIKSLQAEKKALQDAIREMDETKHELTEELERIRSEQGLRKQKLEEEIAALESQAAIKQGRLNDLSKELQVRDPSAADADQVLQELWFPTITVDEFGPDKGEELPEEQALENVRNYLEAQGLRFPNRVLNAFHTSLKTSGDSPLLVLAGISGTGKSLLPRRYAEAMGIHFLNVPVQPRWDGPQDLLGFYNYLENRYKATDLLRALLQMDTQYRSWSQKKIETANEHLLLVLLDEMNLARVEYYFSEFLSRLETRRDIDKDDDHDRRKAEIPIEVGKVKGIDEDDPLRVFVDTNVFFVGTINEDESALSLSDKVVDRANVMRFGRPRDLSNVPGEAPKLASSLRASAPLHTQNWNQWIEEGKTRTPPAELEGYIERLNEALEQIGRPFGFRTRRAILTYLRMYPDRGEEQIRLALADQVEQRVLPKLRGVDVSDPQGSQAIEEVAHIVEELGDTELREAIDSATRSGRGTLFNWAGVDRTE